MKKKYEFANNIRTVERENIVIIACEESKQWIKISKQCYDILKEMLGMGLNSIEMYDSFDLEEDREYFKNLVNTLENMGAIAEELSESNRVLESIYLLLTDRCNLSCLHCCADAKDDIKSNELTTKQVLESIDKILQVNPKVITLSGGEPLLRDDIWEIVSYIRLKFNGHLSIMTNGLLINDKNVDKICKYFNDVSISIDGVDEESCKILRGVDIYSTILDKVKLLQKHKLKEISLSAVLPNNEKIEEEFYKLNEKMCTTPLIRYFSYSGRGAINNLKINKMIDEYLNKRGFSKSTIKDWSLFISDDKNEIMPGKCGACEHNISIGSNGNIYPCNLLMDEKYCIGNILYIKDFNEYLNSLNTDIDGFKKFYDLKNCNNGKCIDCDVNIFCWDCPADYNDLLKQDKVFEERCSQVKEVLSKVVWR